MVYNKSDIYEIAEHNRYIQNSFERCLKYDIDKNTKISKRIIEAEELDRKLLSSKELIITARPFIEKLYDFVKGSEFFIILTDHEGCILNIIGDESILGDAKNIMMIPGAYMSEECIGTNAMGTCIAEDMPVQISGHEHFVTAYHGWTCSGAPIHDKDGNVIGSLDLTGYSTSVHSHTLGMVVAAVKAIESILKLNTKNKLLRESNMIIESLFDSIKEGIVHCDLHGNIISSNTQACKLFGYKKKTLEMLSVSNLIVNWETVRESILNDDEFQECDVQINAKTNKLYYNLNAYTVSENKTINSMILMFKDVKKVRKLANKIMGHKAVYTFEKIIGNSQVMIEVIEFAKKVATGKSTILITGESGCGKEVFAQAIQNYSPRREEPFIAINCGAIPRNLMESELFGYEDGAFTGAKRGGQVGKFEVADGGTLFLDEIGELPLEMQAKLLRVIEEGTLVRVGGTEEISVNVRLIAATNKKLKEEVKQGNFRQDLYYRLNVIPILLPPLRERKSDIPILVDYFMHKIALRINKKPIEIKPDEMALLNDYPWPGNVRELENFIELAINKEKLPIELIREEVLTAQSSIENYECLSLDEMEKLHIIRVLKVHDNNITAAAKKLGIGRNTLYRKLEKYGIDYE